MNVPAFPDFIPPMARYVYLAIAEHTRLAHQMAGWLLPVRTALPVSTALQRPKLNAPPGRTLVTQRCSARLVLVAHIHQERRVLILPRRALFVPMQRFLPMMAQQCVQDVMLDMLVREE